MRKPKVFVTRLIPAAGLEQVREYCDADIWTEPLPPPADVLRRKVSDCEGLLSLLTERIDGALLDAAPRLRVVSNYAVGFNNIDIPAATERGIAVGNTPGLLADSDFISAHADLNDTTRGMFNAAAFARMKPTAVFVNTARGPLVVEADLAAALLKGTIFAAGLDVTDPEPPLAGNPLVGLRNCIVAPHIASATVSSRNAMAEIAADNLIAGLKGQPLRAWVNPEVAANLRK